MVWLTTRLIYVSCDHGVAYHTSHIRLISSRDHGVAYHTSHISRDHVTMV